MILSKTPYRISLFGGGTDLDDWLKKNEALIISFAINKNCNLVFKTLPSFFSHKSRFVYSKTELVNSHKNIKHPSIRKCIEYFNIKEGIELIHQGDLPAGSGVGSSSSFTVCLISLFNYYKKLNLSKKEIAKIAIFIEQKMIKEKVGVQDQIISTYGGLNKININKNKDFKIKPIKLEKKQIVEFEKSMLLIFSGTQRNSSQIQNSINYSYKENQSILSSINNLAHQSEKYFSKKNFNIEKIGSLVEESWNLKKNLSKEIQNKEIEIIINIAKKIGIYGSKLIGAGGGGFVLLIFPNSKRKKIIETFHNKKYQVIEFKINNTGTKIFDI